MEFQTINVPKNTTKTSTNVGVVSYSTSSAMYQNYLYLVENANKIKNGIITNNVAISGNYSDINNNANYLISNGDLNVEGWIFQHQLSGTTTNYASITPKYLSTNNIKLQNKTGKNVEISVDTQGNLDLNSSGLNGGTW